MEKPLVTKGTDHLEVHFQRTFPSGTTVKVSISGPSSQSTVRSLIRHLEIIAEEYPSLDQTPQEDA